MKNKKLHFKIKKRLLLLIIIEILAIIYLLNMVLSSQSINFKPIFVNVPMKVVYENNTNSSLKYFYTNKPNDYQLIKSTSNTYTNSTIIFSTNSDGLRERYNYSREKPPNTFRIAIFGDSFTYGLYLNITDVYTEILEDRLNSLNCSKRIEVLNFGVSGYDLPYEVELFRQKGKYYNSDINIFTVKNDDIIIINDIWQQVFEKNMRQAGSPDVYSNSNNFFEENKKVVDEYLSITRDFNSSYLLNEQIEKPFNILYNENEGKSKILIFTFIINPEFNEFVRNASKEYRFEFLSLNGIGNNYINLWNEKFSAIPEKDPHPNKLGQQLLADFLYIYLVSNNLIEC